MQRTVLFILSSSYAVSHDVSLMLGSHPKAMHVGQVDPWCPMCGLCLTRRKTGKDAWWVTRPACARSELEALNGVTERST